MEKQFALVVLFWLYVFYVHRLSNDSSLNWLQFSWFYGHRLVTKLQTPNRRMNKLFK